MSDKKSTILAFLPVMKELEMAGINPVDVMFSDKSISLDLIGECYRAIRRAKEKYPAWYAVVGAGIGKCLG